MKGNLFETGSAKWLRIKDGKPQFVSSQSSADVFDSDKVDEVVKTYDLSYCQKTLEFQPLRSSRFVWEDGDYTVSPPEES